MGWLNTLLNKIAGVAPTDWTLLDNLADPGLNISGNPVKPDECYLEVYVESLRLEKARRFATTFDGVIYSFASMARQGAKRAELASVTKPKNLTALNQNQLSNVITVSKRIMAAMPWRGNPLGLELGLFSVKTGNLLTPLTAYVTKVAAQAGISTAVVSPFLPLVTEGLDMIAGQTADTAIELAIDTDMSLSKSQILALIAKPKGNVNQAAISIDPQDHKLLDNGQPLNAAYCVFSIRTTDRNADWGSIPALEQAYEDLKSAILSGKRKEAEEALAGFNRQVIICPDLIPADKTRLKDLAKDEVHQAFPGGSQAAEPQTLRDRFANRKLSDLRLYQD